MLYTYFLGILLCVESGLALYDSRTDVIDLTPSNFDRLVTDGNEVWLVEFYAPWCGHCQNLVPEYKKAAKALKGIVKVGAMDADKHKSFAHKFGVSGFPSIKIFTGSNHIPYKGQRTADAMVDAALKATREKAYQQLGRKGGDYASDKQSKPETFGHIIPWKQAIQNNQKSKQTSGKPLTQKRDPQLSESAETCKPQKNITQAIVQKNTTKKVGRKQNTTYKIVGQSVTKNLQKRNITKKIILKKTISKNATSKTSTTKKVTIKTTTMSVVNRFRLLQNQLFRGQILDGDKPKIVNALMKLKSVLQGRGVVNASIIKRRSAQRQRKQNISSI